MRVEKKKAINILILCSIMLLLIIVALTILRLYDRSQLKSLLNDNIVIEYGNGISIEDILKQKDAVNISTSPPLDSLKNVGNYIVKVKLNEEVFDINIEIKDSTPPTLEVQDVTRYTDEEVPDVNAFVTVSSDLSVYEILPIELETTVGEHEVEIVAQDIHGNVTKKTAKFTLKEDKDSPVFTGLKDITVYVGTHPDLHSGVSAVDARFGDMEYLVDDSKVSYNTPGKYTITYSSQDPVGNVVTATRTITIVKRSEERRVGKECRSRWSPYH